tara:strand:+ start:305 stop:601 length:297 start_codon:yes stop_codon:yes gene_type:complete
MMNKYEIVLKYNQPEIQYASTEGIAILNFKESTPIQLKGKGCDSIVEVRLLKQYTESEWQERLDSMKGSTRRQLASLFPETYKLEDGKFYIKGEFQED